MKYPDHHFLFPSIWPMNHKPALALYQPDIAGNTGTLLRLSACLGTTLHLIEPAGFRHDDVALKRSGMDYLDIASLVRHVSFEHFETWRREQEMRLILMTTRAQEDYLAFSFLPGDIIMLGRESSGVPQTIHDLADASIKITMQENARSLNQALSGAMVIGEALRQMPTA